jgi:DNA-binding response OmpR family regulator
MSDQDLRVLVVDEPAIRRRVAMALSKHGVQCDHAENGVDALRLMKSTRYDAVVTELAMPQMNGHALAVEILSMPDRPLVMIVTGIQEPRLAQDLMARGVDDLLFKPVDFAGLALKLKILLDRRTAVRTRLADPPPVVEAAATLSR